MRATFFSSDVAVLTAEKKGRDGPPKSKNGYDCCRVIYRKRGLGSKDGQPVKIPEEETTASRAAPHPTANLGWAN